MTCNKLDIYLAEGNISNNSICITNISPHFIQNTQKFAQLFEKDCKKMSNHIDFVENVYERVKTPFTFIMDNVNNIVYNRNQSITES